MSAENYIPRLPLPLAVLLLCAQFCIPGCQGETARIPRPRAYPRIEFPARTYVTFDMPDCPLSFSHPDYMTIVKRENLYDHSPAHPCWFDLEAQQLGATLHFSYYQIGSEKAFDDLVTDAFRMADRITQRADYMDEIRVANANGVNGVIMEFSGAAASPLHFYLSDSTAHFLKASLYFQTKVVPDSLAPVLDFLKEDLAAMINSLEFK